MINLNPKIWGPHAWFFIDSIIISLPNIIDNTLQNEIKHFLLSLSTILPCEKCRYHFSGYLKETDLPNIDFSTKDKVIKWINTLHNQVNNRNNTKNISIDNMIKYYNNIYNIETKSSYLHIFLLLLFIIFIIFLIKYFYFLKIEQIKL